MKTIKENWKVVLIAAAGILTAILLCVFGIQSTQNKAFALEEQINTAESDIKVQEKRRVDLVYNLADCVVQYDKHEADTLTAIVVVDGKKCKMYMKNFGEFFNNQVEHAGTIVISRTQSMADEKLEECAVLLREHNGHAAMITTPWDELDGRKILEAMHHAELEMGEYDHHHHKEACGHAHHHGGECEHDHHHDGECEHGHHHHNGEGGHEHHHEHDDELYLRLSRSSPS